MVWYPVAPSGRGGRTLPVWVRPVPSVALTAIVWAPGVKSCSRYHCRQVSMDSSRGRCAFVQSPWSTRTCTLEMPRVWAHATPAMVMVPAVMSPSRGVSIRDWVLMGPFLDHPLGTQ